MIDKYLTQVGDLGYRRRLKTIIDMLDIQDSDRILDVGSGEGFLKSILNEISMAEVVNWDKEDGDIEEGFPFAPDTFDKIVCAEVLEHLHNDFKALVEIKRILKPDGTLIITVPNKNYPFLFDPLNWIREHLGWGHFKCGVWAKDHKRLYSNYELWDLTTEAGFTWVGIEWLTRWCVPFYYYILRAGKLTFAKHIDKFAWEKNLVWYFTLPLKFMEWIDSFNERIFSDPSIHIAVKLKKEGE